MANNYAAVDTFANLYATPRVLNPALAVRGAVYFSRCVITVAAAHVSGSIYPCFRMPAHARLLALWVGNDAIASVTDIDFGIYTAVDWSAGDGAVKDKDIYVDGISMAAVRNVNVDPAQTLATAAIGSMFNTLGVSLTGSTSITGIQWARRIWEDAGDAVEPRPGTEYDLCWTANTDPAGAGTILTGIFFVMGA